MAKFYRYPSSPAAGSNASVGQNGLIAPDYSTEVAGINPSGNLQPLQTNSSGDLLVTLSPTGVSTVRIEDTSGNALTSTSNALDVNLKTSSITLPVSSVQLPTTIGSQVIAASLAVNIASDQVVPVSASALPLPSGAATSANQLTEIASLSNIDTSTSSLNTKVTTTANGIKVDGSAVTQPISAASLPLPTGAATEATVSSTNSIIAARLSGSLVPAAYDYLSITYVPSGPAIGQINTVAYYLGGSGGTLQATLTLGYDGSGNLSTVTKS